MWPTKFITLKIHVILAISLGPAAVGSAPSAELVLTHLECFNYAKDIVNIFDYRLIPYRGRNVINGSFAYSRSMTKKNTRLLLDFEKPDKTRFQMMDLRVDICELLIGESGHKLLKMVLRQMAEQKQFLHKCPQEANKTYELIMYDIQVPKFPLPNLKVTVTIIMYDEDNIRKLTEIRLKGATKRRA